MTQASASAIRDHNARELARQAAVRRWLRSLSAVSWTGAVRVAFQTVDPCATQELSTTRVSAVHAGLAVSRPS